MLLHPGDVYRNGIFAGSEIWSDDSDATYTLLSLTSGGTTDTAHGWIPPLVSNGRVMVDLFLHFRAAGSSTAFGSGEVAFQIDASVVFNNPGGGGSGPFLDIRFSNASVSAHGAVEDITVGATDFDFNELGIGRAGVQARLEGGSGSTAGLRAIGFNLATDADPVPPGVTRTMTVYEAWLEVVFRDQAAPLRLRPRAKGGLGAGRNWPPDRVVR